MATTDRPIARFAAPLLVLALLISACTGADDALDVAELTEQVAAVRGLPVEQPVEAELRDPQAFGDLMVDLAERREGAQTVALTPEDGLRILAALRFVPPDADLAALQERLLREGVSGVYVPEDEILYVNSEQDEPTPFTTVLIAHEVTHALQDQSFDLGRLIELQAGGDGDAFLAFSSVVEGDATLTMNEWSGAHQSEQERQAYQQEAETNGQEGLDALADLPPYLVSSTVFPYAAGAEFVRAIEQAGGREAVDEALREPPTTTAEILDPQRYLDEVEPEAVGPAPAPGAGYSEVATQTFGAFDLAQLVGAVGEQEASQVAQGWNGGALAAFERGEDLAVGVRIRFDDEAAAATACAALPRWYEAVAGGTPSGEGIWQGDRDVLAVRCEPGGVSLGLGPDAPTVSALTAA